LALTTVATPESEGLVEMANFVTEAHRTAVRSLDLP
jgi:hypothetical protein